MTNYQKQSQHSSRYLQNSLAGLLATTASYFGSGCATTKHAVPYQQATPAIHKISLDDLATQSLFEVQHATPADAKGILGGYAPIVYVPLKDGSFKQVSIDAVVDKKTQQNYADVLETLMPQTGETSVVRIADSAQSLINAVSYTRDNTTPPVRFVVDVKRGTTPDKYTTITIGFEEVPQGKSVYTSKDRAKPMGLATQSLINGGAGAVYGGVPGFAIGTIATPLIDYVKSATRNRPKTQSNLYDNKNQPAELDQYLRGDFSFGSQKLVAPYAITSQNGTRHSGTLSYTLGSFLGVEQVIQTAQYDAGQNKIRFQIKPNQLDAVVPLVYLASSYAGKEQANTSNSDVTGGVIGSPGGKP
jgi:hypothetical protein